MVTQQQIQSQIAPKEACGSFVLQGRFGETWQTSAGRVTVKG